MIKVSKGGFLLLALILNSFVATGLAQKTRPVTRPEKIVRLGTIASTTVAGGETPLNLTPAQKLRWEAFTKVWQTLDDLYFDRTFNGLDWNKVKAEYRPRIIAATSDAEAHRILDEMVQRLGRSHFAIMPPEMLQTIRDAKRAARKRERALKRETGGQKVDEPVAEEDEKDDGPLDESAQFGTGIDLRMLDDKFVVTRVEERSAAELAGIKAGFVIDKINGVSISDLVRRIVLYYPNSKSLGRYLPLQIVNWFLNGEKDTPLSVTCLDDKDEAREFTMTRMQLAGESVQIGANYPEQFLVFETKSLDGDTGYIRFNVFSFSVIEKFCNALSQFHDKKSLVIDLRGNIGGLFGTLIGVAGMLTDKPMDFGTSISRNSSEKILISPKAKHFSGRIVVLTDGQSTSAAELFAAGLAENDRVLVVGTTTAGAALPAVSVPLATGAVFMFPIANFKTKKGKYIEGTGLEPNFASSLDRASLLKGVDAPLSKATQLIAENKAFPVPVVEKTGETNVADLPPPPKPKPTPAPVIAGEIREVYNGKSAFVESDYGYERDLSKYGDTSGADLFAQIVLLYDTSKFTSLKYLGIFDRDGKKCHIIEGRLNSMPAALAFDVESKMLVSFAGYGSPIVFGDYRKVGDVMLPHHIAVERLYDIDLTDVKINAPVDEAHFKRKENCFDKPL